MYEISKPDGVIVAISPDKLIYKIQEIFFPNFRYLVEKPIGLNLKESEKIYNFARRKRIQIFVGLNRRFYSSTKYLLRKLKNEFSKNRIIEIEDQQDQIINKKIFSKKILDNYMFVNSIHLIDYFNLLCRGKVIKIKKTSNWISRKKYIYMSFTL